MRSSNYGRIWRGRLALFLIPLAVAAAITGSVLMAGAQDGGGGTPGLDVGLSDADRATKYARLRGESAEEQARLIRDVISSGIDISTLPHTQTAAFYGRTNIALGELVAQSHSIIQAEVMSQRLEAREGLPSAAQVVSRLRVVRVIAGLVPATDLELVQPGYPVIRGGDYALGILDSDPVLAKGSEVIVFLAQRSDGRFEALPFSTLDLNDAKVTPNQFNGALADLKNRTATDVIDLIGEHRDAR